MIIPHLAILLLLAPPQSLSDLPNTHDHHFLHRLSFFGHLGHDHGHHHDLLLLSTCSSLSFFGPLPAVVMCAVSCCRELTSRPPALVSNLMMRMGMRMPLSNEDDEGLYHQQQTLCTTPSFVWLRRGSHSEFSGNIRI